MAEGDWYESWVVSHVKRIGLLKGKYAAELTALLIERRAILIGQRGATAPRLAATTERCLFDSPAPRFLEHRWDAVCRHLKTVIAEETKAAETMQAADRVRAEAAGGSLRAYPQAAAACRDLGLSNLARIAMGEPTPLSPAPPPTAKPSRPPATPDPNPTAGPDTSFDPETFDRTEDEE